MQIGFVMDDNEGKMTPIKVANALLGVYLVINTIIDRDFLILVFPMAYMIFSMFGIYGMLFM